MPQVKRLKAATHRFLKENRNMKIKNVFDEIFSIDNLYAALEDASQGRRYNKDALVYNLDAWAMVQEIRNEIFNGTYSIERYYIFYVYEPKKRMIMSISFKHRIVQWAIYRVINPVLVKGYIEDSYGCIPGRGSLSAMQRLKYWVVMASRKEEQWFYLKLDISKYFYRISHRVLKKILAKKIKDKRLLKVLYSIIDCEHTPFGLPLGRSPGDVPLEERLFDVGMPIGNLLSQLFANVKKNSSPHSHLASAGTLHDGFLVTTPRLSTSSGCSKHHMKFFSDRLLRTTFPSFHGKANPASGSFRNLYSKFNSS